MRSKTCCGGDVDTCLTCMKLAAGVYLKIHLSHTLNSWHPVNLPYSSPLYNCLNSLLKGVFADGPIDVEQDELFRAAASVLLQLKVAA